MPAGLREIAQGITLSCSSALGSRDPRLEGLEHTRLGHGSSIASSCPTLFGSNGLDCVAEAVFVLFGYISLSRCALELGSQKTLSGPSGEVAWRIFLAFVRRRRGALGGLCSRPERYLTGSTCTQEQQSSRPRGPDLRVHTVPEGFR